ncbi:hypothetical protein LRS06_06550 [Hymenobacter sp. J193]|uniref:hypothetical protein n=1 Tax=Hymenobacter sp. J193 TaxID=2898429 RepID=UPI002150DE9D|nr:hypothetical protein [Hymenobacter sp. J193]MCR5887446.1 hypothetical protein [Hymenobacter sp. J193]
MLRPLLLTLLLALLPLAFGVYVNSTGHPPTTTRRAAYCTRYCYYHACPHATAANSPAYVRLRPLYSATVRGLASGGRKYYEAMNLAFYLGLTPALLVWLTYGALRNRQTLRHLRSRLRHA